MAQMTKSMVVAAGLVVAFGFQILTAQSAPPDTRLFVGVNGGYQGRSQDITVRTTFSRYGEQGTIEAAQKVKGGGLFDAGVGYRVWRNVAVGVAFTRVASKADAAVSVQVPHPLFVNEPRSVTGGASGLEHSEFGTHIQVMYVLPLADRLDVTLSGGPSFFNVKQALVQDVTITEAGPPSFAATLANVAVNRPSKSAAGFNVGADATYMVTRQIGAGFFLRYAAASVDVPVLGGGSVSLDAGGVQAGGGLRVRF